MLKIKKAKFSGFRGILKPQELDFREGSGSPRSLVIYGLNSSGKSSFVDGFEWFFSADNQIEWLRRSEAEERAYPHQEAQNGESFVEIDFDGTKNKIPTLTKTYNHEAVTKPILSSATAFNEIYNSYTIRPYLRYLEVIDFVYNRTGLQKYEKLAGWMGFESELAFQEKIALGILPGLKKYDKELGGKVQVFERQVSTLIGKPKVTDPTILGFCNEILARNKLIALKSLLDIDGGVSEITKLRTGSSVGIAVDKLTQAEVGLAGTILHKTLIAEIVEVNSKVQEAKEEQIVIQKIDIMNLYTQALDILLKQETEETTCPVCGKVWDRNQLTQHIKDELGLLQKVKEEKEALEVSVADLQTTIKRELELIGKIIARFKEVESVMGGIQYEKVKAYLEFLQDADENFSQRPVYQAKPTSARIEIFNDCQKEKESIIEAIKKQKTKIQPSAAEIKLSEDIEHLTQIRNYWKGIEGARHEQNFAQNEITNFTELSNVLVKAVQDHIKSRFNEISDRIGKYFKTLRSDKEIKDIEIVLNETTGKAAGRSAEIQLKYYDISVKPAYKVLSESLLNSLGLAVYFACVKQFNKECNFLILDDIMNSLDIDKRDTLLDLLDGEFADFQIILFTHDLYWFQKIMRRFPAWIHKKIKSWDYKGGAKIDSARTTEGEIDEFLKDSTKIEAAGWALGKHVDDILNELCENIWAELRYRYTKNDPPALEELFTALHKRLKDKANGNPLIDMVLEAKKYEPVLRNFVSHSRANAAASVSPEEIKRAEEKWFSLEKELLCEHCHRYVEYHFTKDTIECRCGDKKILKQTTAKSS